MGTVGHGDIGGMGTLEAWGHEYKNHSSSTTLPPLEFDSRGTGRVGTSVDPVFNSSRTLSAPPTLPVEYKRACATSQQRQQVPWTLSQRRQERSKRPHPPGSNPRPSRPPPRAIGPPRP